MKKYNLYIFIPNILDKLIKVLYNAIFICKLIICICKFTFVCKIITIVNLQM